MVLANALINVDPGLIIWVAVTLIAFIAILAKYVWKPLLAALKERENSIRQSLEAADHAIKKAEEISKKNENALKEAEQIAQKIRKQAQEDAELMRADRLEKAKSEADEILEKAKKSIEIEKKKAMDELRNEVAGLALGAAKTILNAELDAVKNKKLVDDYLKEVSNN